MPNIASPPPAAIATPGRDPAAEGNRAYIVALFFLAFACSYADRQIISILVQPLKEALSLSDTQIGLVQGFAFTICYATAGLFVARLVDVSNRVAVSAVCILIWSLATMMCGTATGIATLVFWRAGTAIAEAGLSPAASSVFSDLYPPRKVARATSIFMLGPYFGGGLALLGGGTLLGWLNQPEPLAALATHGLAPWQVCFFVLGLPGLLLAGLLYFTVAEPARHRFAPRPATMNAAADDTVPNLRDLLHALFRQNRFGLPFFAAYIFLIVVFYAHTAWFPTLLIRTFGVPASTVGQFAGPTFMIGGTCGVLVAGFLASRGDDAQTLRRVLLIAGCAATILVPLALAAPLVGHFGLSLGLFGLCAFAMSIVQALAPVPIQVAIPNRMRGRAIALLVFLTNAIAGSLGPLAVGAGADWTARSAPSLHGLGLGLAAVGTICAAASAALYFIAARRTGTAGKAAAPAPLCSETQP
ncbi:MFS transporter [Xanthobacter variabilis]|uniref:MFS transporter n=1 Tax=Xanthobacter variabilis TaxID=3119932 RepID=UPI0037275967